MVSIIITIIVVIIATYIGTIQEQQKHEQQKQQKEKEEQLKKLKKKQREQDISKVISFAKNKGFDNISELIKERDNLYYQAVRNYATGVLTKPLISNTVKANYSGSIIGSFGDYRAEQINKERQQQYNDLLTASNNSINVGMGYKRKYKVTEKIIFNKLKEIPNSDEYINILRNYFDEDEKVFKQK